MRAILYILTSLAVIGLAPRAINLSMQYRATLPEPETMAVFPSMPSPPAFSISRMK